MERRRDKSCQHPNCPRKRRPEFCHCTYCDKSFCIVHRLPETHDCDNEAGIRCKAALAKKLKEEAVPESRRLEDI